MKKETNCVVLIYNYVIYIINKGFKSPNSRINQISYLIMYICNKINNDF